MQSLEAACEEAERLIKKAKFQPSSVPALSRQEISNGPSDQLNTGFCIHTKLRQLYEEECAKDKESGQTNLRSSSILLEKLVARERLNTLIINLYPGNKGYSFARRKYIKRIENADLPSTSSNNSEEMVLEIESSEQLAYEEYDMLRCIDNEELHPAIADLLEQDNSELYYDGCVVAEVRDYRQSFPNVKRGDIHYVLLKPTMRTMYKYINRVSNEYEFNNEERLSLESQFLLATKGPLCLDPSPSVAVTANRIQHERQLFNTRPMRKAARKFSQVTVNRKRKLIAHTHHKGLELYEYITRHRMRQRSTSVMNPIPVPSVELPPLEHPTSPVKVAEMAKSNVWTRPVADAQPHILEEYIFETDQRQGPVNHIKLSILQRPWNLEYLGEIYLDRDHKRGESQGSACRFSLGTSYTHASSYKKQFMEIFTDYGRKSVQIIRRQPGKPDRVDYKGDLRSRIAQLTAQQTNPGMNNTNQTATASSHILSNGTVQMPSGVVLLQQGTQNTTPIVTVSQSSTTVPILPSQLQQTNQIKPIVRHSNPEIRAIANNFMNSAQQFQQQAAANAATAAKSSSSNTSNNAAILSLLNSPANHINSAASTAVANAITNNSNAITIVGLAPQQSQTNTQKLRKMAITTNFPNSRLVNRSNQVNNNNNSLPQQLQINLLASQLQSSTGNVNQSQQAFTLTPYTTLPLNNASQNKSTNGRLIASNASSPGSIKRVASTPSPGPDNNVSNSVPGLQALLKGTAAADHPIPGANSDSILLERIRASSGTSPVPSASPTHFTVTKNVSSFQTQSPKPNTTVVSPLSSPPLQVAQPTVHSLNLTQLANLTGLQNEYVQVQISGFPTPISLPISVSSGGTLTGHPTNVLVTLPVTTGTGTSSSNAQMVSAVAVTGASTIGTNNPSMVQLSAYLAPGLKSNVRGNSGQSVHVLRPPRAVASQLTTAGRQNLPPRNTLSPQRMMHGSLRMTAPNAVPGQAVAVTTLTGTTANLAAGNSVVTLSGQPQQQQQLQLTLQKQAQLQIQQIQQCLTQQQLQQCLNQQQQKAGVVTSAAVATKYRRRSNAADTNK